MRTLVQIEQQLRGTEDGFSHSKVVDELHKDNNRLLVIFNYMAKNFKNTLNYKLNTLIKNLLQDKVDLNEIKKELKASNIDLSYILKSYYENKINFTIDAARYEEIDIQESVLSFFESNFEDEDNIEYLLNIGITPNMISVILINKLKSREVSVSKVFSILISLLTDKDILLFIDFTKEEYKMNTVYLYNIVSTDNFIKALGYNEEVIIKVISDNDNYTEEELVELKEDIQDRITRLKHLKKTSIQKI